MSKVKNDDKIPVLNFLKYVGKKRSENDQLLFGSWMKEIGGVGSWYEELVSMSLNTNRYIYIYIYINLTRPISAWIPIEFQPM